MSVSDSELRTAIDSALSVSNSALLEKFSSSPIEVRAALEFLSGAAGHSEMIAYLELVDPFDEITPGELLFTEAQTHYHLENGFSDNLETELDNAEVPSIEEAANSGVEQAPVLDAIPVEVDPAPPGDSVKQESDHIDAQMDVAEEPSQTASASDLEAGPSIGDGPDSSFMGSMEPSIDGYDEYMNSEPMFSGFADVDGPESVDEVVEQSAEPSDSIKIPASQQISKAEEDLILDLNAKVENIGTREPIGVRNFIKALKHQYLDNGVLQMTVGALGDLSHKFDLERDSNLTNLVEYTLDSDDGTGKSKVEIKDLINYDATFNANGWPWYREKIAKEAIENAKDKLKEVAETSKNDNEKGNAAQSDDKSTEIEDAIKKLADEVKDIKSRSAPSGGGGGGGMGSDILGLGKVAKAASDAVIGTGWHASNLGSKVIDKTSAGANTLLETVSGRSEASPVWSESAVALAGMNAEERLKSINSSQKEQLKSIRTFLSCKDRADASIRQAKIEMGKENGDPDSHFLKARSEITKGQSALLDLDKGGLASLTGPATSMLDGAHKSMQETEKNLDRLTKKDGGKFPHGEKLIEAIRELMDKIMDFLRSLGIGKGRSQAASPSPGS